MSLMHQIIFFIKYGLTGGLAVALDMAIYVTLTWHAFMQPGIANALSAPLGCVIGYILAGKTLFRQNGILATGYIVLTIYQLVMISVYSLLIQTVVGYGGDKYWAKIIVTGLSFCINSHFFKYVILAHYVKHTDKK